MAAIFGGLQRRLFPALREEVGELTDLDQRFVQVVSVLRLEPLLVPYQWAGVGRPPLSRHALALSFIAKAIYNFPTTRHLLDALRTRPTLRRLCGYEGRGEIPDEATFSRAFADFAAGELPQQLHATLVKEHVAPRLIGHVSRDATAIEAREKVVAVAKPPPPPPQRRGRPKKGEVRPTPPPTRLELQPTRSLEENVADLPRHCAIGVKRNSKGYQETWRGYKLHLDSVDGDLPVSALLTAASVHDSQVAIPLAQMTAQRVTSLYDLMDAAYDAPQIYAFSRHLAHVPIIDANPRRGDALPMAPAQAVRFRERSTAERVNSNLKDNYGGRYVRVRGAVKVMGHLMFGLVALTALQLFHLLR
ncbi:MAG: transposase [Terriglobales bacterium]